MDRQLRPRRQGVPSDHNYFAQYPNTIYTTPSGSQSSHTIDNDSGKFEPPPVKKKKRSSSVTNKDANENPETAKVKKRWHYFGYRKKRKGKNFYNRLEDTKNVKNENIGIAVKRKSKQTILPGKHIEVRSKTSLISKCKCCCRWRLSRKERRQSQRLVIKNLKLPFEELPDLCKLAIFSLLSVTERGRVALVCKEWRRLIRHPGLWSHIDFNVFNPTANSAAQRGLSLTQYPWFMTLSDYNKYCLRMQKYVLFLEDITPHVHHLRFAYDLVNPKDEWLQQLLSFLKHSNCRNLLSVEMNWTRTPVRPPCADRYCCYFNKARIALQKHITRVLFFHRFLNKLTKAAPQVIQASLPFDWSERSVLMLCRWRQLKSLRLDSYIQLRLSLHELLDLVLEKLKELRELQLSVCTPLMDASDGANYISIRHARLDSLDIQQCKGIFLQTLNTPALTVLNVRLISWAEASTSRQYYPPCLYSVIKQGVPHLQYFNTHRLHDYWLEYPYEELENMLTGSCPCKTHMKKLLQQHAEQNTH